MTAPQVTTAPFTSTPNGYVRRVATMWFGRWWWLILLPVAVCFAAAFHEAVWLFVALMIVFLLYPAVVAFIYFNYALTPEARTTLMAHTVTVSDKNILVRYPEQNETERYTADSVKSIEYGRKSVTINLKRPRYNHIYIPLSAVDENDRQSFFGILETLTPPVA